MEELWGIAKPSQLFLLKRKRHSVAREGESKGERLGSFSFAISSWNDKEMAAIVAQRTREAVCARRRSSRKFSFPPPVASPTP